MQGNSMRLPVLDENQAGQPPGSLEAAWRAAAGEPLELHDPALRAQGLARLNAEAFARPAGRDALPASPQFMEEQRQPLAASPADYLRAHALLARSQDSAGGVATLGQDRGHGQRRITDLERKAAQSREYPGLTGNVKAWASGVSSGMADTVTLANKVNPLFYLQNWALRASGLRPPDWEPAPLSRAMGIPQAEDIPETARPSFYAGEFMGGSVLPTAGVLGAGLRAAGKIGGAALSGTGAGSQMLRAVGESPRMFLAGEAGSALGGSSAVFASEHVLPDSPTARAVAGALGGFGPLPVGAYAAGRIAKAAAGSPAPAGPSAATVLGHEIERAAVAEGKTFDDVLREARTQSGPGAATASNQALHDFAATMARRDPEFGARLAAAEGAAFGRMAEDIAGAVGSAPNPGPLFGMAQPKGNPFAAVLSESSGRSGETLARLEALRSQTADSAALRAAARAFIFEQGDPLQAAIRIGMPLERGGPSLAQWLRDNGAMTTTEFAAAKRSAERIIAGRAAREASAGTSLNNYGMVPEVGDLRAALRKPTSASSAAKALGLRTSGYTSAAGARTANSALARMRADELEQLQSAMLGANGQSVEGLLNAYRRGPAVATTPQPVPMPARVPFWLKPGNQGSAAQQFIVEDPAPPVHGYVWR